MLIATNAYVTGVWSMLLITSAHHLTKWLLWYINAKLGMKMPGFFYIQKLMNPAEARF